MNTNVVKTEIVQRKFDGKFTLWGFMPDPRFVWEEYSSNPVVTYTPYTWIALGVFDEQEAARKHRLNFQSHK